MNIKERRAHPRLNKDIKVKVMTHGFDIYAMTKNICCSGAFCEVNRLIPNMTRLDILLFLPNSIDEKKIKKIHAKGVVVRSEPIISSERLVSTNIAIFFTDIKEKDKNAISEFVDYYLKRL